MFWGCVKRSGGDRWEGDSGRRGMERWINNRIGQQLEEGVSTDQESVDFDTIQGWGQGQGGG